MGAVAAFAYLYPRVDEELRRRVEACFAEHYGQLKVTVRSAQLIQGEGIEVRGVSVSQPGVQGPAAELLRVEEVFLRCRGDMEELISGQLDLREIIMRRPRLRAARLADGTWTTAQLLPFPKLSARPPDLIVENGTIEIVDPFKVPAATLTLRDVNLKLAAPPAYQESAEGPHPRRLQGTLTGDFMRRVELDGLVDPRQLKGTIGGSVEGLEISPELREALPGDLAARLAPLSSLRAQAVLGFRVSFDWSSQAPWRFDLSGQLTQGRIDDPRLPHPVNDLHAGFQVNNEGLVVADLVARSSQSVLRIKSFRLAGFDLSRPMQLEAEVRQLELDPQWLNLFPDHMRDWWPKYLPSGQVHLDVKLAYDGKSWKPELLVECLDASFTYYRFPYRLHQGRGVLELKDDVLRINLTALAGNTPVRIRGQVAHPLSTPYGQVEAEGDDLLLDEKLFSAILDAKSQAVVRSLDPRGSVAFYLRVWSERPDQPAHRHLEVGLNRCAVRYRHFPYPLSDIRGMLVMDDDAWTFTGLRGSNDTGKVTCEGRLVPTPQGSELLLRLQGKDVPLEEELRDALGRPNMRQLWNDLKPQGMIDLAAEVRYLSSQGQLSVAFQAQPHSDNASIEPAYFPYRLENLRGTIVYRDGEMRLEDFSAQHGSVTLSANGQCDFFADGGWQFRLERLAVDRVRLDRELLAAMPERLRKMLVGLDLSGPMNLQGDFLLARGGRPEDPLRSQWDLSAVFHQGSLDCGVRLENLNGGLRLVGGFDGQRLASQGELDLDSVTCRDFQLTGVRGPIWIDDQRVLLGTSVAGTLRVPSAADPQQAIPVSSGQLGAADGTRSVPATADGTRSVPATAAQPRPITAQLLGGTLYGDGWVALGPVPRYELNASLANADLATCAQEHLSGRQNLRGRVFASVKLQGAGRSVNALGGYGAIQLRDADVYELPLMIALLKVLSIREPDRTAFSSSDVKFHVSGGYVYFDQINFHGDAISLDGAGEMDFQSNVRMTFRAMLGRDEMRIPVVRDLFKGASQQIMQIHVSGTLQDPVTRREAFPVVGQALQLFQRAPPRGAVVPEVRSAEGRGTASQ